MTILMGTVVAVFTLLNVCCIPLILVCKYENFAFLHLCIQAQLWVKCLSETSYSQPNVPHSTRQFFFKDVNRPVKLAHLLTSFLPFPHRQIRCKLTMSSPPPAHGIRRKTPSELRQEQLQRAVRPRNIEEEASGVLPPRRKHLTEESSHFPKADVSGNSGDLEINENACGKFRGVTQLSLGTELRASECGLDMTEALKLLAPAVEGSFNVRPLDLAHGAESLHFCPDELESPPLDLSLKLSVRFSSISPLHWCRRLNSTSEVEGLNRFVEKCKIIDDGIHCQTKMLHGNKVINVFGTRFCQALQSWVYPPPEYVQLYDTALASIPDDGRRSAMMDGLHQMWEAAFRSLYYMFYHNRCNLFYLCTQTFVVMFERGNGNEGDENGSYAYWTRSTRGLRKVLREQGVEFSMPFWSSETDLSSFENVDELAEYEKVNPGRTRLADLSATIDGSSHSLLAFKAESVHQLFDFLLNFRHLMASAGRAQVPTLYSSVEFNSASLYMPEVKCKHVKYSAEEAAKDPPFCSDGVKSGNEDATDMYSLELNGPPGAYIMPWVVMGICMVLQQSQALGFEGSFDTGPLSEALNIAQGRWSPEKRHLHAGGKEFSKISKVLSAVSRTETSVIKYLRCCNGLYRATMACHS